MKETFLMIILMILWGVGCTVFSLGLAILLCKKFKFDFPIIGVLSWCFILLYCLLSAIIGYLIC
jgi:hypothetical protein